jgi:hypothetical protein
MEPYLSFSGQHSPAMVFRANFALISCLSKHSRDERVVCARIAENSVSQCLTCNVHFPYNEHILLLRHSHGCSWTRHAACSALSLVFSEPSQRIAVGEWATAKEGVSAWGQSASGPTRYEDP